MTAPTRSESRVALLLPGRAYSVNHPAMYYVAEVARDLGWRTQAVSWDVNDMSDEAVVGRGRAALLALPAAGSVVIGKSLGSLLLPDVAELGLPAVWLTPLLTRDDVRLAAARRSAPTLLVGGTDDDLWDSQAAHATGCEVLELDGGDHRLQLAGDAVGSVRMLGALAQRARTFFESLP